MSTHERNARHPTPLPATGFLRQRQILGDRRADPPIPAILPIGKTAWWEGIAKGKYPKPVKLGPRTTAWRVDDIKALLDRMAGDVV
jgi:predicted DNA-binding transcriptional regulator AlpA